MKTNFQTILVMIVLTLVGFNSHAELYLVKEKCQITENRFSLSTNLKSMVENGISEHKYSSRLTIKGQKTIALKPQSEIDETPMSMGSSYTLVNAAKGKKILLTVRKGVEKSSFSSSKDTACGPVLSVKEYSVKIRGLEKAPVMATMTCDQRSVFVSSKCDSAKKLAKSN